MKKLFILVLMLSVTAMFSACSTRIVDFTVISSKNASVSGKVGKRVKGSDGTCAFLYPNMKEALDRAIEQEPGADALVDGVVYYKSYYVWHAYEVEGTAVNTKSK